MSRYIDADKIIQIASNMENNCLKFGSEGFAKHWDFCKHILESAPRVDAVEVIRCKDCKYAIEGDVVFGIPDYYCRKHGIHCLSETDFAVTAKGEKVMARYIDAEKALEIAEKKDAYECHIGDFQDFKEVINDVPTADVQEVRHLTPCNVCKYNPPSSGDGKPCSICPACAKMDGKE